MIKRQDYRLLHSRNDDESSCSSSSATSTASTSDNGCSPLAEESSSEEEEVSDHSQEVNSPVTSPSQGAGDVSTSGRAEKNGRKLSNQWLEAVEADLLEEIDDSMVLKTGRNKSVLRCRLCPKTICLSNGFMRIHLGSIGHARAKKQYLEGKLKVMLNSDGEEENVEDGETHAERFSRTIAVTQQEAPKPELQKKKQTGRQRQRMRAKKKAEAAAKRKADKPASVIRKSDETPPKISTKDKALSNPATIATKKTKKQAAVVTDDQKAEKPASVIHNSAVTPPKICSKGKAHGNPATRATKTKKKKQGAVVTDEKKVESKKRPSRVDSDAADPEKQLLELFESQKKRKKCLSGIRESSPVHSRSEN